MVTPSALQLRDQREQALGLARRQRGRRLVHDQQRAPCATAPWRSRPAASRRRSARRTRVSGLGLQADLVRAPRAASRASRRRRAASPASSRGRGRCSARCVRSSARLNSWWISTMPGASASREPAKAGCACRRRSSAPPLGCFVAGEDLHQRGLAGAVLAEQAVDAAGREREADAVQHLHRAEALDQLVEADRQAHRTSPELRRTCVDITVMPGALTSGHTAEDGRIDAVLQPFLSSTDRLRLEVVDEGVIGHLRQRHLAVEQAPAQVSLPAGIALAA